MAEVIAAADAVARIDDGASVVVCGTGPVLEPDLVLSALERAFIDTGRPRDLSLLSPMCVGERAGRGGLNTFAHPGMLRRFLGSSLNVERHPALVDMLRSGEVEGYIVGMGTIMQMLQAAGSGKPGVLTTVGLGTFLDPRSEGGRMNGRSTDAIAEVVDVRGEEHLFYPAPRVDVAIIRATTADEHGYLAMDEETNVLGVLDMALAAKASGGIVIAQVKRLVARGSLDPRTVRVPGPLVDLVVVSPEQRQLTTDGIRPGYGGEPNPAFVGGVRDPLTSVAPLAPGPARVLLRQAFRELVAGDVINVGAGLPTLLPQIAHEEGVLDDVTFTNEHGIFGGLLATAVGGSFVPAFNPSAIMDSGFQFGFYDGGHLDVTFLGAGEVDARGDVNVSRFGNRWMGTGGFCDITDRTRRIVFCSTLTSGGLRTETRDGRLVVTSEGRHQKFVPKVEQVTFNARRALARGQLVRYITERAVFDLDEEGLVLSEVAPGIDVARDIQPSVGFPVRCSPALKVMDVAVLADVPLGLAGASARQVTASARSTA